jgi:hypothetical protein
MGMENFQSVRDLLAMFVEQESHTPQGQDRMADLIVEQMRARHLDAIKVPYPSGSALPPGLNSSDPRPSNVICYIGKRSPDKVSRNTLLEWHFDTVAPNPEYGNSTDGFKVYPYSLRTPNPNKPNEMAGLGAGDMKCSGAGFIIAAEQLRDELDDDQGVTILGVTNEELYSEGIHAAQDGDLLRHVTEGISGEIEVGSYLGQDPVLLAGRPGRVELHVGVNGESSHAGRAKLLRHKDRRKSPFVSDAVSYILQHAWSMRLPEDERDFPNTFIGNVRRFFYSGYQSVMRNPEDRHLLMPRGEIVPAKEQSKAPPGLNVANEAHLQLEVFYSNPALNPDQICDMVREKLRAMLPNVKIDVQRDSVRATPPTGPWRENVRGEPFIQDSFRIARELHPRAKYLSLKSGLPTADEPIFNRRRKFPIIGIPPDMWGEHTAEEILDLYSISEWQIPLVQKIVLRPFPKRKLHAA